MQPPFDPSEYARKRGRSTAPPPWATSRPHAESARPSDSFELTTTESGRHMLALPESRFFASLDERVRRAELLHVFLRTGGISRTTAARALRAQLGAIRQGASALGAPQLVALLEELGAVVAELGEIPRETNANARDLLVLDEDEVARDLVALAAESNEHTVRCAASFDELILLFEERRPDVVISDAELSNAPLRFFCAALRDVVGEVPIVLFTTRDDEEVAATARAAQVARCVPKQRGVESLISELEGLFSRPMNSDVPQAVSSP